MNLQNGYKVIYEKAADGKRAFYASKTGLFADDCRYSVFISKGMAENYGIKCNYDRFPWLQLYLYNDFCSFASNPIFAQ